jgi:hypothetical protein
MLWVTRSRIRVNRAATGWLVRRFIDPSAEFRFVDPADVVGIERRENGLGFDAPGARYPHRDPAGRCSFEALVHQCRPCDPAMRYLAQLVHWADFPNEMERSWPAPAPLLGSFDRASAHWGTRERTPRTAMAEAVGLRVISSGFPLVAADDHETLARSAFLYDALYASLQERLGP